MNTIIIATVKTWNIENYFILKERYSDKYDFVLITDFNELTFDKVSSVAPDYIFFPHWSWVIPKSIYENYECVLFHMTDLPYGRGGSPLQNLIVRGIYETKITALKVDSGIDTGKVYFKERFSIALGSAEEIFISMSQLIFEKMIPRILKSKITPVDQKGEPTTFCRLKPCQSDLLSVDIKTLQQLYDFIRMLDGEGYPKAFIDLGNLRLALHSIHRGSHRLTGAFEVTKK